MANQKRHVEGDPDPREKVDLESPRGASWKDQKSILGQSWLRNAIFRAAYHIKAAKSQAIATHLLLYHDRKQRGRSLLPSRQKDTPFYQCAMEANL